MFWVILTIALLLSVALIVMVLLQPSKGGGITAAFGGIGGSIGSTFGQRRTLEFLGKATTWTAAGIALLCIVANLFFIPSSGTTQQPVTTGAKAPAAGVQQQAPVVPTPQAPSAPATGGQQQEGGQGAQQQPTEQPPANNNGGN